MEGLHAKTDGQKREARMYVCPADGHAIDSRDVKGPHCSRHGVRLFTHCRQCGKRWPLVAKRNYGWEPASGADFCAVCGTPAPWLSRAQLLEWVRNQLRASADISSPTALELVEALKRVEEMDANDTKTIEAWRKLRDAAPKVWATAKPAFDVLLGEAVKRMLGL